MDMPRGVIPLPCQKNVVPSTNLPHGSNVTTYGMLCKKGETLEQNIVLRAGDVVVVP